MELKNKTVLIIGGSSGIGLAAAALAHKHGASVTLTGTTEQKSKHAAASIGNAGYAVLDVNREEEVHRFVGRFEGIDHIFNAAGSTQFGSVLEGSMAEHLALINTRLAGSVHLIRAAAKKINAGGSFIFTGAVSTDRPVQGAWTSGVATAAAEQLARVMALELAPIRFNAISPGFTDTPMWDKVLGENKTAVIASVAEKSLVKRIATAEEVAEAVIFLMKNESITGEIIHIDGGARLV